MSKRFDGFTQTQFHYSIKDVDRAIRNGIGFTMVESYAGSFRYEFGVLDRVIVQCFQEAPDITRVAISTEARVKPLFSFGESLNQRRVVEKVITNIGRNLRKLRKSTPPPAAQTASQPAAQASAAPSTVADQLFKLAELLKQGLITRDEFDEQKRRILK